MDRVIRSGSQPTVVTVESGEVLINDHRTFTGPPDELLDIFEDLITREEPALVVTSNVDQVIDLQRLDATRRAYDAADLIVLDGMPLVFLARLLGARDVHRHTGSDLLPQLAALSPRRGWHLAILGGAPEVTRRAADQLMSGTPGARVTPIELPLLDSADDPAGRETVKALADAAPDIVFVCLGAPKQEQWYLHWRDELPPAIYIGAGAAVDFAADAQRRAPGLAQRIGAVWLWRLAQEPRRLAGRYLRKGPAFLGVIARSLGRRRRPYAGRPAQ